MKATGIVRRIDDLGRVVIPKEIRRTLRIRESDPLEIFTDREGEIILKKYSPIGELGNFAKEYAESLAQVAGCMVCICDHDQVIAAAGSGSKEYLGKRIHSELEDVIADRGNDVVTDIQHHHMRRGQHRHCDPAWKRGRQGIYGDRAEACPGGFRISGTSDGTVGKRKNSAPARNR